MNFKIPVKPDPSMNSAGLVSQTAMISGRARISVRCIQRAAAEANSRPISPQPMMPKGILRMA